MKKQKRNNSNGITLIALVISIIVMLILAGVSINAIVGDNGILSKASMATYLNSCAVIEEYFNQLYATMAIDGVDERETPLNTIMKNGYENYFFSTSDGYYLKKSYENEEAGETQNLVLYLLRKEELPEDVKQQIQGRENLDSRDYRRLKGVYGITSDLNVYYCVDGIENMYGAEISDLNADSPDIVYADEDSALADIINGGTEPVTNQGLKTIKTLTIDTTAKLALLADFDKLSNLTTVTFKSIPTVIPDLEGIGGAMALKYVKFYNCEVTDYSALNGVSTLKELYLVQPKGKDVEIARLGSETQGIALGNFSNLQYFGIMGNDTYQNSTKLEYAGTRYNIVDISPIANFSDTTKQAIKYLNLQNLRVTDISCLSGFTNVYFLRLEENALTTLNGIQNMSKLKYLFAPYQYSDALAATTLGSGEGDSAGDDDALKYIYKNSGVNTDLYFVDLRKNDKLKYVDGLSGCTGIEYLYLSGCTNIQNPSTIASVIGQCGKNYSIEKDYGLEIISDNVALLNLSNKTLTISEFEQLKNKNNLTHLNLQGITIKDDDDNTLDDTTTPTLNEEINSVLETCKNLEYLNLRKLEKLTTIDFVAENKCTKLVELDLMGTSVVNLLSLNNYATNLRTLRIDNTAIDLTTIQPTINRFHAKTKEENEDKVSISYWFDVGDQIIDGVKEVGGWGLICSEFSLYKQLEECRDLTILYWRHQTYATIDRSLYLDLTNCRNLETVNSWGYGYKRILPNTVKNVTIYYGIPPEIEAGANLELLRLNNYSSYIGLTIEDWENTFDSLQNTYIEDLSLFSGSETIANFAGLFERATNLSVESLHLEGPDPSWNENKMTNLNGLKNLASSLKHFYCRWHYGITDISEITYLINLETLDISCTGVREIKAEDVGSVTTLKNFYCKSNQITNIEALKTLVELEDIDVSNNKIKSTKGLENATNLVTANLKNNQITDIYALRNCFKLETLNLENNILSDFGYYKNEAGSSIGYNVTDIFYDLNKGKKGELKELFIFDNNITDLEVLKDLSWDDTTGVFEVEETGGEI